MPSQALNFAELLVGGLVATMGVTGASAREVVAGKAGKIRPIATGSGAGSAGSGEGSRGGAAFEQSAGRGANPLPDWSFSRIDAGVDYAGGKQIFAPEGGVIRKLGPYGGHSGGFGPGGILLESHSGRLWYFYEGLNAIVREGEEVAAGQEIATAVPGGSIEVGFANAEGDPLAQVAGESTGNNITKWGRKAAEALNLLGAAR